MSMNVECGPCQMGEHDRHYRVVQAVPEGMLGGVVCMCEGECVERGPRHDPQIDAVVDMLRSAHHDQRGTG